MNFTLFTLVSILFCLTIVQAAPSQIYFNSQPQEEENLPSLRDTAQAHYESIVDNILSQHNEGILTELSFVIKDPQEMYSIMKPQVEVLFEQDYSDVIQDVCVAQMPGMIANQIHELSNQIYARIESVVLNKWKKSDTYYREIIVNSIDKGLWEQDILDDLIQSIEMLNMNIADHIVEAIDEFNMLGKLKQSLKHCQDIFSERTEQDHVSTSLSESLWKAVLVSLHLSNPNPEPKKTGFMGKYVFDLRTDLQSEMYSRVYELATGIFEDLAYSN
ncbi:hypothetical protein BD770DRAFT_441966 [Pilaira anomala]|nr:hypothetical protein BD770DRAFT_441966 [Pilaira anomala]